MIVKHFLYTNVSQSGVLIIPLAEFDFTNSDWTRGKGRKDVFIQYITKFTKVQSHVSLKNLELVKSNSSILQWNTEKNVPRYVVYKNSKLTNENIQNY
jgi:hypothetical protein